MRTFYHLPDHHHLLFANIRAGRHLGGRALPRVREYMGEGRVKEEFGWMDGRKGGGGGYGVQIEIMRLTHKPIEL